MSEYIFKNKKDIEEKQINEVKLTERTENTYTESQVFSILQELGANVSTQKLKEIKEVK